MNNPPLILRPFRYFDITGHAGDVYMRRYYLIRWGWFNVYLHHIRRSDEDLCLHDHPWNFLSVILWGGYREVMIDGVHRRRPGSVLYRRGTQRHRVELDRPAWTLVFVGRKYRPWGFFTKLGWRAFRPGQDRPLCEDFAPAVASPQPAPRPRTIGGAT